MQAQAAVKKNVAYDLSRFDNRHMVREQVAKEKTEAKAKAKQVAKAKTRPMVISGFAVFSYITCMALIVLTLFSYVKLTETSDQASKLQSTLDEMREETQMLEIEKNQKFSPETIKNEATTRLGMKKLDKSQVTYVNMEQGDKVEILSDNQILSDNNGIIAGIIDGFQWIVEYMN